MGTNSLIHIDDSAGSGPLYIFDVNNNRDIMAFYNDETEVFALMSDGFIRTNSAWKYKEVSIGVGDFAADNDAWTYPLLIAKHDITLSSVHISANAAVVANASNYQTIYLEQSGSSTDISSMATSSTGFSARVPREFASLDSTAKSIKAGDTLQLRLAKTASGVAMYGVTVSITFFIDQPRTTIGTATDNVLRVVNDVSTGARLKLDSQTRPFMSVRENGNEKFHIDILGKMHGAFLPNMEAYTPPDQYYYQVVNTGQLVTAETGAKFSPLLKPVATVQVEKIWVGATETIANDSATNYWNVKITDETNILVDCDLYKYGSGTALTKGVFYEMGDINRNWGRVASGTELFVEYTQGGTGPTTDGLTFCICFTKVD